MVGAKNRKPVPRNRRPAIKNSTDILTEFAGCLLTALLWGWITAQAVIGMIESRIITNDTVLAAVGVMSDE